MSALGIDTTGVMVTVDQAAQIENVLGSNDADSLKKAHIEEIIAGEATATGRLGTDQLRSSISAEMASLGLDTEMVPMLSVEQLAEIENVTALDRHRRLEAAQITEIVGSDHRRRRRDGRQRRRGDGRRGRARDQHQRDRGVERRPDDPDPDGAERHRDDTEKKAQIERIIAE